MMGRDVSPRGPLDHFAAFDGRLARSTSSGSRAEPRERRPYLGNLKHVCGGNHALDLISVSVLRRHVSLAEEWFDVVNERDEVIRRATRREVHATGLWHRAVHVLVFD